ncbi:MAG TPA: VOC family protein [Gemmataceae bacterium]|nr:VOC family protein [Gemmataceae bacterium]
MIRGLYLVELTVADWPAAVAWYRDLLGLALLLRDEVNCFALLRAGAGRLALKAGRPDPGSVLLTFEVDDLPAELQRLAEQGVVSESPLKASPEGYRRALLRDPDGHRLCLFDWNAPAAGH